MNTDGGKTSLHFATEKSHLQVMEALFAKGACPLLQDLNNKSAMDYAATPGVRNVIQGVMNKPKPTGSTAFCVKRSSAAPFNYNVRNKSLVDLLDLDQFSDPYAHNIDMSQIGRGALKDERSKPKNHHKSMPYMLDSIGAAESGGQDGGTGNTRHSSLSLEFKSFNTISDSEIDFTNHINKDSLPPPTTALKPIVEEDRSTARFRIGGSESSSERKSSTVTDSTREDSLTQRRDDVFSDPVYRDFETHSSIDSNNSATTGTSTTATVHSDDVTALAHSDDEPVHAASPPPRDVISIQRSTNSFKCKVPLQRLVETLEVMHEKVDLSVDRSVDVLNDVFRDVTNLRQKAKTIDANARENAFNDIEKNIKDVVVRLKELKIKFDGHILDV